MQLNIMFISSNYPPRIGGPATTVPKIAKELSRNNKVSVITFIEKNTKSFEQDEFKLYRSPTFYFFGFSNPVSVGIRTALISIFSRIIAFKENPFIIHAQDNHISAVAALFVKYTSLKKRIVIMKYAGDLTLEFSGLENKKGCSIEEIFKNPTPKQKLLISFQGALFRHSNFVHAQNDYQKSILAKVYKINPKKIIIIPNPVDLTIFTFKEKRIQKNRFEILAVSRLVQ
ncbi:MAG: glycosyltransferase [Candidatus Diapherotrites archaeon]|nr:glycosyltransferase [Candidatus Diapherotrites archaeon]